MRYWSADTLIWQVSLIFIMTWMSHIKNVFCLGWLFSWSIAAMLHDIIVVLHIRPWAILLASFTIMREVIPRFLQVWCSSSLLRSQERPATLILTVTSGLHLTHARLVYNKDAETRNWKFVLQLRKIRMQKCVNHNSLSASHGHPGSNFHGKKIKNQNQNLNHQLNDLLRIFFSFRVNKNLWLRRTGGTCWTLGLVSPPSQA